MKYLPLLFLFLSFGVKGQIVITTTADGELHKQVIRQSNIVDTPQADRNPNDFYVDTLGDTSYVMNTPHGRISSKDLSLEEKLLQYAAECWNDSTVKYNHFEFYWKESLPSQNNSSGRANTFIGQVAGSVITNCIQKPGIYPAGHRDCYCNTNYEECTREKYPHHYTKKTTHREPTFKGFIEYLKKK